LHPSIEKIPVASRTSANVIFHCPSQNFYLLLNCVLQ